MDYIELACKPVRGSHITELLIARLAEIGFESFIEGDEELYAYIQVPCFTPKVETELSSKGLKALIASFSRKLIPDQNWNALWESAYEPVVIDDRCTIRAPFHKKNENIKFDIVIEPKMSFGTAHHETTRLMIRFILEMELSGKSVLDMGCGTGVLAILACMKGAGPVTAIDNDEWAYKNALENLSNIKPCDIEVLFGDSSLLAGRHFNVICANINRNILLNDLLEYRKCLSVNGLLVMSGFYEEDFPLISAKAIEHSMQCVSFHSDNRWIAACYIVR